RRRSDPSFQYSPKQLKGDIGVGKYGGADREIVWDLRDEFPMGLQGSDYYFVVDAKDIESGHSAGILTWIGAGAAVIIAAVTYVIVMHNGGPRSPSSYPAPPGRP
ncbi:MAG: hypothetical protein M1339_06835, partial [Bacteroidetes bacterium]|nr:hypothetical protein [Bacteroidota bacterium]